MKPILPGATIGVLGGGQLGRMVAMAARNLGYRVNALDPDPQCAARGVVDETITATFDDELAAAWLARRCDVVTLEIEKIAIPVLDAAAARAPVRPGAEILAMVQDRGRQKQWLADHGFPLGRWRRCADAASVAATCAEYGDQAFVKATFGGYDGRGQVEVRDAAGAATAFADLGGVPVVVEAALPLDLELSVMVARRPSGEVAVFPPSLNHHEQRILAWSVLPAPLPAPLLAQAEEIARGIALASRIEGVLAIELFVSNGRILVNELAPRPHNSFHATERGTVTSQFEQLVRAVCDLPLGDTRVTTPTAIVNLLGDAWLGLRPPDLAGALALPGVRLHLYGKSDARPGRKMGHLSAIGATPEEAVATARRAEAVLLGRVG